MKAVFLLFLFTVSAVMCFGIIQFGAGFDILGNHEIETTNGGPSTDYDVKLGISPAFEYLFRMQNLLFGFGAEYQVQRGVEFTDDSKLMGFVPIFGTLRYQFPTSLHVNPEIVGHFGYNFLTGDDKYINNFGKKHLEGGIYWGVGTTFIISGKYYLQAMYKTNKGKYGYDNSDTEVDVINTQINLSAGMRVW